MELDFSKLESLTEFTFDDEETPAEIEAAAAPPVEPKREDFMLVPSYDVQEVERLKRLIKSQVEYLENEAGLGGSLIGSLGGALETAAEAIAILTNDKEYSQQIRDFLIFT